MSVCRFSFTVRSLILSACMLGASTHQAMAAGPILVQGAQAAITVEDIEADALRMPEQMRATVLVRPQTVTQIGTGLYVRRVMAAEAKKLGLDKAPDVQANLRVAEDKALSDAYLIHLDKTHTVGDDAALAQARSIYKVTPERFKADEQVRIRHILIAGSDDAARAKAETLLKSLRGGADFAEVAKQNSIDPGSAAKGGELGFVSKGKTIPEFETAAFALKSVGDLSDVVQTKFGFHILQLEERRPAGVQPFEEVRDSLMQEVRTKVATDARVAEAEKIQAQAQPQTAAIEGFSRDYSPTKK